MLLPGDRKREALMPVLGVRVNATIQSLRRFSMLGFSEAPERRSGAVDELVDELEIRTPSLEQPVEFLSGGNQQKVSVSRSFLREPVGDPGLRADPGCRRRLPVRHLQALRARTDSGAALLVKSSDPIELSGLCDRVLVMSRGTIVEEIPGDELDELRIIEAIVRGPGLSKAGRSPLGVAMPKASGRRRPHDHDRRALDSRGSWSARSCAMPGTRTNGARSSRSGSGCRSRSRSCCSSGWSGTPTPVSPGFVNATNVTQILILALPLIVATIAQTHALLVGYLDLSVGAMISLGVVIASFLIGAEATDLADPDRGRGDPACGVALGLVNAGLIRGVKIPSIIATLATLSILDGISLTLRPTAQGIISGDLVSFLTASIGPIPIAFIVVVVGAALLDCLASRLRVGARGAGGRVRREVGEAGRDQDQLGPGAGPRPLGGLGRRGLVLRDGPAPDRQRPDRLDLTP